MSHSHNNIELLCVLVNFGQGTKVKKFAKKQGIPGATIILGKGTVKSRVLELLEINETKKEIIIMAAEKDLVLTTLEKLNEKFKFYKSNHGIAFSTSITNIFGTQTLQNKHIESRGVKEQMYNLILTIVEKGDAESVVNAANKCGSKGATIIKARGSGIHETKKLLSIDIEPEKEIVLIISESKRTEEIVASIREELQIDKPGNGIIFVQEVNEAYGLY